MMGPQDPDPQRSATVPRYKLAVIIWLAHLPRPHRHARRARSGDHPVAAVSANAPGDGDPRPHDGVPADPGYAANLRPLAEAAPAERGTTGPGLGITACRNHPSPVSGGEEETSRGVSPSR
jgi:hypothetical protein